jgi:hypothetical protein
MIKACAKLLCGHRAGTVCAEAHVQRPGRGLCIPRIPFGRESHVLRRSRRHEIDAFFASSESEKNRRVADVRRHFPRLKTTSHGLSYTRIWRVVLFFNSERASRMEFLVARHLRACPFVGVGSGLAGTTGPRRISRPRYTRRYTDFRISSSAVATSRQSTPLYESVKGLNYQGLNGSGAVIWWARWDSNPHGPQWPIGF